MSFNSYIFILLFFPLTLIIYFMLAKNEQSKRAHIFLITASLIFITYGGSWQSLIIFAISIAVNYMAYRLLNGKYEHSKKILIIAVVFNLLLLGGFKYAFTFASNLNAFIGTNFGLEAVILPIGISFYTFQQIAFVVNTYRGEIKDCDLTDYLCYMCFFPRFVSGPIVMPEQFLTQLHDNERLRFNWKNFSKGLYRFSLGLGKKVIVADTLGTAVTLVYSNIDAYNNPLDIYIAVISFALQLYFDFSAYTDMAIGIANMFNLELPENFDSPYKALNIDEFWNKWHITLTKFLTKYVYFPLGGNRAGVIRTYINILIVFLVSGLWHGNFVLLPFVVWGMMHGAASVVYRLFKKKIDAWHPALNWFITFNFVSMAWVPFKTQSVATTYHIWRKMLLLGNLSALSADLTACFKLKLVTFIETIMGNPSWSTISYLDFIVFIAITMFFVISGKNTRELSDNFKPNPLNAVASAFLMVYCMLSFTGVGAFIYAGF